VKPIAVICRVAFEVGSAVIKLEKASEIKFTFSPVGLRGLASGGRADKAPFIRPARDVIPGS
jgi:hypothetical protein